MLRDITRYVRWRTDRGDWCERTAQVFRNHLRDFGEHVGWRDPGKVKPKHVEAWASRPGLAPAYRRIRLSAVRGFFRWLTERRQIDRDPTIGIRAPKIPPYAPRNFDQDEVARILHATNDPRTRLVILLMVQEGFRRVEVARAELGDIDWRRNTIHVRGKGGHGKPTRTLPISAQTRHAIDQYLEAEPHGHGPLIQSRKNPGRGVAAATISEWVLHTLREAGVKTANGDGKSAHALRHTCAQDILEAGADIRQVQAVLGHASIRTTETYLRSGAGPLRGVMAGRDYG